MTWLEKQQLIFREQWFADSKLFKDMAHCDRILHHWYATYKTGLSTSKETIFADAKKYIAENHPQYLYILK